MKRSVERPDADVARFTSRCRILVVTTREELAMLRDIKRAIGMEENTPL